MNLNNINRRNLVGGAARFDKEPYFKSKLPYNPIESSSVRVDPKSINSIYNNLGIPSFLYDLLTIYFIIKNDYNIDKSLIHSMTTYNTSNDGDSSFKPWGLYDIDTIAKFLNDKFSPLTDNINIDIKNFIGEYEKKKNELDIVNETIEYTQLKNQKDVLNCRKLVLEVDLGIKRDDGSKSNHNLRDDLHDFYNLLELTQRAINKLYNLMSEQKIREYREDFFLYINLACHIIKQLEIIDIEYDYTIKPKKKKIILYRSTNTPNTKRDSYSFSTSLLAGFFSDTGACSICYILEEYLTPINERDLEQNYLSLFITDPFDPYKYSDILFIPPFSPIVSLLGSGELFHTRTKIHKELLEDTEDTEALLTGYADKYIPPQLISNVTPIDIVSRFFMKTPYTKIMVSTKYNKKGYSYINIRIIDMDNREDNYHLFDELSDDESTDEEELSAVTGYKYVSKPGVVTPRPF